MLTARVRIVESPDGKAVKPPSNSADPLGKDVCETMRKLESDSEERRVWHDHQRSVLGPIEAEITARIRASTDRSASFDLPVRAHASATIADDIAFICARDGLSRLIRSALLRASCVRPVPRQSWQRSSETSSSSTASTKGTTRNRAATEAPGELGLVVDRARRARRVGGVGGGR